MSRSARVPVPGLSSRHSASFFSIWERNTLENLSAISRTGVYLANGDTGHPWRDSLIDAGISAGSAFFATLGGMAVAGIEAEPMAAVLAGLIGAGGAFFFSIRVARERSRKFHRRQRR